MSTPSPPPGYASDPQLIMLWTAPLDLTGNQMQASGGSSTMPPESMPFTVNLTTVQAAQQAMLDAGSTVVGAYNPMEQEVQQDIGEGTFFGQQATYNTEGFSGAHPVPHYGVADAPLQNMAQQFGAQMNPAMTRVLRVIADGMSTVGAYIAMLNNAGQIYTGSDKSSAVPPPPAPGGGS
jgi:hypothetical protein